MARKLTGKPNGRPLRSFDNEKFEDYCGILCTQKEIASLLHMDIPMLIRKVKKFYGVTFAIAYSRFTNGGRMSLRRKQFKLAETSSQMCIWLGKQSVWLGQSDVQRIEHTFIKKEDEIIQLESSYNRLEVKDIELEVEVVKEEEGNR